MIVIYYYVSMDVTIIGKFYSTWKQSRRTVNQIVFKSVSVSLSSSLPGPESSFGSEATKHLVFMKPTTKSKGALRNSAK